AADELDQQTEDYSFNWLDPDKKIYVLQNRKFTKAHKLLLTLNGGIADTSPYRSSYSIDPRLAYYFTEAWGVEVFYAAFSNSSNSTNDALIRTNANIRPNIYELKSQVGGLLHWAPWYAKINVFNSVLYFDWSIAGGIGSITGDVYGSSSGSNSGSSSSTKNGTASYTTYILNTGPQFHVSEHFVVRFDYTNSWYKAPLFYTSGDETWFNSHRFQVGLGFRL
ncbi:MAG: outer membrane beta-barrel domain-containing protein, partial [Proteobacteria bacterium]